MTKPQATEPTPSGPSQHAEVGPRVFRNILTLVGGQGLSLTISGVATILLARYLGQEQLGEFGALYAYLGLYSWLTTFGLDTILARHVAQERERAGSILLTGICVSFLFALCATAIALAVAPSVGYGGPLRGLMVFASIDVLMLAPLRLPGIVFQVDLRQWYGVGIGLARQFAWLVVLVVCAAAGAGLFWIILGRSLCAVMEVAFIWTAIYRKGFLSGPWRVLPSEAWQYVRYGLPVAVSSLAVGIYHRIDQVMLHKMVNDQVLGNYVASVRLAELVSLFPIAVMSSMFPILAQAAGDEARFRHYLRLSFRSLMAIAFGICIFATLFAGPIVHLLYGLKFAAAAPLLAVLIWSEVPVFFGVVVSNALVAKNLQNYLPLSTIAGAAVNVGLNLFLIPRWGALGSAWATNASELLAAVLLFLIFRPTRPVAWPGFRIAVAPASLALLIVGAIYAFSPPTLIALPVVIVSYGLGALVTGAVRRTEVAQVWQLVGTSVALLKTSVAARAL